MALVSVLQWTSAASWDTNQQALLRLFAKLPAERPQLVVLPEMFSHFGAGESAQGRYAEPERDGVVQQFIAALAREHGVWVIAGTIPVAAGERYAAASFVFDDQGEVRARYDKIHLFDAAVSDETKNYRESSFTRPGQNLVVVDTPFGRLGLAVCYDVRFPELFRALRRQGAELISLPSAFTRVTGEAHWEILVRARAIENQVYMLAPDQWGRHADGRETWGQSMIVDAWGNVLAERASGEGVISATIDLPTLHKHRQNMPFEQHNQFEVTFVESKS